MSNSESFLNKLQAQGRIAFTSVEYAAALSLSPTAAMHSLLRLRRKQEIASPVRGLHVVLPPADRANGSRPAEEFVDYLMKFLKSSYYVALLSAAEIQGAAHHRPQMFQVIVTSRRRAIRCGNARIQFFEIATVQRLGFILDKVGATEIANSVEGEVRKRAPRSVVLVPGKRSARNVVTDKRWRIIVNDIVQPDI
jgi:hypothetical protein